MEKINEIVANNIAILRKKNRLSLEELGKLSGVSKSMLAQVERGEGNPTLSADRKRRRKSHFRDSLEDRQWTGCAF